LRYERALPFCPKHWLLCQERTATSTVIHDSYWPEHLQKLQDFLNSQLDTNHLSLRTSYGDGSQDEDCDRDSSGSDGGGSQDEDYDPDSSSRDGDSSLYTDRDTDPGALSSDGAAAALRADAKYLAGAIAKRAQADAAKVAKQKAAAAANTAKQREAAAAAKKLRQAIAAKRTDDFIAIQEACRRADHEGISLTAPSAEPAPHLSFRDSVFTKTAQEEARYDGGEGLLTKQ
jgi:hypothetical protein